jgi:phosphatidate cytidylyltransferase
VGGPKLWPSVSPNKTWSGAIGGSLCAIIAGLIVVAAAGLDRLSATAVVGFGLSLAAAAGDLLESALKRRFGAKDASRLIPGHGGLMDRLDGFLTATVAGAMLGIARGGMDAPARGLLLW